GSRRPIIPAPARSSLQLDAAALLNRFERGERERRRAPDRFECVRMWLLTTQERDPGRHLLGVALAGELADDAAPLAMDGQGLEIADLRDQPGREHRAQLFRPTAVALAAVDELAARAVRELHLRREAVGERRPTRGGGERLRAHSYRLGLEQEAEEVEKVARLAEHSPAALGEIREPVRRIERAGHHAIARALR